MLKGAIIGITTGVSVWLINEDDFIKGKDIFELTCGKKRILFVFFVNFSSIEIFNVNEMADKVIKYFFDKYQINVEKKYIDKDVKYDDYILDIELLKKFDNLNFTPIHEGISRQIDYEMGQKSIVELYNVL